MKPRKQKPLPPGDDLWDWAARRPSPTLREEEPPSRPPWYREVLQKISGQPTQ